MKIGPRTMPYEVACKVAVAPHTEGTEEVDSVVVCHNSEMTLDGVLFDDEVFVWLGWECCWVRLGGCLCV